MKSPIFPNFLRMIKRKPTMLLPNKSDIDLEWTNRKKNSQNEPVRSLVNFISYVLYLSSKLK